jgi:hypothetical protein
MFGLCLHLLNQPGALHRFTETGIVFDIGRDRQLPARLQALHHDGVQTGARHRWRRSARPAPNQ